MKKNKKLLIAISVLTFCLVAIVAYRHYCQSTDKGEIRIGVILPLTGMGSLEGEMARDAILVARNQIERETGRRIEILIEDGRLSAKHSISAFNKLLLHNPNALIVLGDMPVAALSDLINKREIPVIAANVGDSDIVKNNKWIFRGWFSTEKECIRLAKYINDNQYHKVAVLYMSDNFGVSGRDSFVRRLNKGISLVASEAFDFDDYAVQNQIDKIIQAVPDAIFVVGYGPAYTAALNGFRKRAYQGKILTTAAVSAPITVNELIDHGYGIVFADTGFDTHSTDSVVSMFVKEYSQINGRPPNSFSAFEYSSILLLKYVIDKWGMFPDDIRKGLASITNMDTIMGRISYSQDGELDIELSLKQLTNSGIPVLLK